MQGSQFNVVVIDRTPEVLELIKASHLNVPGWSVQTFPSSAEFLVTKPTGPVDLLIIDSSGPDVVPVLRNSVEIREVLVATGGGLSRDFKASCKKVGIRHFLSEPYLEVRFVGKINKILLPEK